MSRMAPGHLDDLRMYAVRRPITVLKLALRVDPFVDDGRCDPRPCDQHRAQQNALHVRTPRSSLQSSGPRLAGTNSHGLAEFRDEYLTVADFTSPCGLDDGFDHTINLVIIDRQFEFYLGQKVDDILRSSIQFSVTLLAPETLDLGHGNALDPDLCECRSHIIELERFDDGNDHFHTGK